MNDNQRFGASDEAAPHTPVEPNPPDHPFGELSEDIQRAVDDMGYTQATPIQAEAIPHILAGRDVMGQAQTGTGKTAAFGIPLIQSLRPKEKGVQAIVLCPTRELALQSTGELRKLARYKQGVRVLAVYGGAPISRQIQELNFGVTVVVGTPGRVIDHLNRGTLNLERVTMAVLDEADEMLDMGFRDDIELILNRTPPERQTLLFSATMPRPILSLARRYQRAPHVIEVERHEMTVEKINQSYIPIRSFHKGELLARLIERDRPQRALIFMATKRAVDEVVTQLTTNGFAAGGLHGDMGQPERDAVMARFRTGALPILVATDVAARGLDVDNVEMVVNYDIPLAAEDYVHRIGRTGRAGKDGKAYTFVVGGEVRRMWEYRGQTGAKILCEQPPTGETVRKVRAQRLVDEARAALNEYEASDDTLLLAARALLYEASEMGAGEDHAARLIAALLNMMNKSGSRAGEDMDLSVPPPPRSPQVTRTGAGYSAAGRNTRYGQSPGYGRPTRRGDYRRGR